MKDDSSRGKNKEKYWKNDPITTRSHMVYIIYTIQTCSQTSKIIEFVFQAHMFHCFSF